MEDKWQYTTDIFDEYERRFAQARAKKKATHPWEAGDRVQILSSVKRMLRYDEALVPVIRGMEEMACVDYGSYCAIACRYETWPNFYGASTLYLPKKEEKMPLVFVCCGHGPQGRHSQSYRAMGHRLASLGIAALMMDNIGQGDRCRSEKPTADLDHWAAVAPFACGLTLQGLIVMETLALIRYMQGDARFDSARFAACGNSGGGTLTMFLAALAPELCALSSSGYPSDIAYLLQKERRHCACNLLVGAAYEAEMWEIYSLFAPKPLLLSSGRWDDLMPMDLARRTARKVKNAYIQRNAPEAFSFALTATKHSWELEDINLISRFLSEHLLHSTPEDASSLEGDEDPTPMTVPMPSDCLTTAQLCRQLTGNVPLETVLLQDVFPPTYQGEPIDPERLQPDVGRGDVVRVFAQFECALYGKEQ